LGGGDSAALSVLLLLASVILAFLLFNVRISGRALVFMGDAGSMFLGLALAWFLIGFSQGEGRLMSPATALWIFALPLIDTVSLMLRRMICGRSPFEADREHFHHILRAAGFSRKQTLAVALTLALTAAAVGLGGFFLGVSEQWMFFGFLSVFGLHFWMVMRVWRVKRFLSRPLFHPEREAG
jgi:UDP-GlcNAc:undecaprenyl-phosphate GlcNAc-1-phosphate transferase